MDYPEFKLLLLFLFYCCCPVVLIYATRKSAFLNKTGTVVLAYVAGIIVGNTGLLPALPETMNQLLAGRAYLPTHEFNALVHRGMLTEGDRFPNQIAQIQQLLMTIIIPLAIPLLLFSLNIKRWLKLARRALLSMLLGIISLLIVITISFLCLKNYIPDAWKVGGMLVGIYTGGTPNMAAIATALHVDPDLFILVNTYEIVAGFLFLLFILTIARRVFNRFLPPFHQSFAPDNPEKAEVTSEEFQKKPGRREWLNIGKSLLLAVVIFAAGGGLSLLVPPTVQMAVVILSITTLGVACSLIPAINRLKESFPLGMYLILIFSLVVASMARLQVLFSIRFIHLFIFVALGLFGTLLLHLLLSRLFRIDTDTTIITMTALSFSPPFVPVVASALHNREIIISGLAVGTLGYIFGNYLGILLAWALHLIR